jgi:hypothetical protein
MAGIRPSVWFNVVVKLMGMAYCYRRRSLFNHLKAMANPIDAPAISSTRKKMRVKNAIPRSNSRSAIMIGMKLIVMRKNRQVRHGDPIVVTCHGGVFGEGSSNAMLMVSLQKDTIG